MSCIRYRSKVDAWLLVTLLGSAAVALVAVIAVGDALPWPLAVAILAPGCVLPAWLLASTHYTFAERELRVRAGPFKWRVPYDRIRAVTPTRDAASSPALSLDRLRIEYGPGQEIIVSPRNRERFLLELEARRGKPV